MPIEGELVSGQRWVFDVDVAEAFDDMLRRSIPEHDAMRDAVARLAARHVEDGGLVVDLGCSRGEALEGVLRERRSRPGGYAIFGVGVESAPAMIAAARRRFERDGSVRIVDRDLRGRFCGLGDLCAVEPGRASVVLAVLTLQFVPMEHRLSVIRESVRSLRPGGAMIVVEKVVGRSARVDDALVAEYFELKARNGYTADEIERKRAALEGVLVPMTARWNEEMLTDAGLVDVECFWRWMNFAGWIAFRDGGPR